MNKIPKEDLCLTHRAGEDGRKEFRERDADREREREREKERRQKEKERIRRQDEDRRRRRERQDGENSFRKREEEVKKEKERAFEKKKGENGGEFTHCERPDKPAKDNKKEDSSKRERLRNKVTTAVLRFSHLLPYLLVSNSFACARASGPASHSVVPARGQKPHSNCRRSRLHRCRQEAGERDQESGRQRRRLSRFVIMAF